MSSKMYLSGLATVATIVIVGAAQDPTFEYPAARHAGFDLPKQDFVSFSQNNDKVSVTFRNATVREVLDWLKNQGVSFVINDDQVNKDGRVSVNAVNQPIETVMKAFAAAWDGHWEKKNDMWVFRKGRDFFGEMPEIAGVGRGTLKLADPSTVKVFSGPEIKAFGDANGTLNGLGNDDFAIAGQEMSKAQQDAFKKAMKNMDDPKVWEEFQKKWENWARDYQKNYQDFEKTFKGQDFKFKFDEKQAEEMRKQAIEMAKSQKDMFKGQWKEFTPFDQKQLEEMSRQARDMATAKGFSYNGKELKQLDEKQMQDMLKRAKEMSKAGSTFNWTGQDFQPFTNSRSKNGKLWNGPGPEVFTSASTHNLKAIFESLTPNQQVKMKRLGYINYSDLNSKQRALLGVITDESWTITYKSDKVNITIKSDR